jgi:hypothetical protein
MIKHFKFSWEWFKARALNRNFQDGEILIVDDQDKIHFVRTRKELWKIAWQTYRPDGTTE